MLLALLACASPSPDDSGGGALPDPVDYSLAGPYAVGHATTTATDDTRGRTLPIEAWYPAAQAGAGTDLAAFVQDADDRATFEALLAAAPAGCPSTHVDATAGLSAAAAPSSGWPVVALSHCHGCTRFSTATAAEHLASHGFVVVAPDHVGNTLFDELAGEGLPLDTTTLSTRVADLGFALDLALAGGVLAGASAGDGEALPLDPARVGVMGHSFGAVTAPLLLQERAGQDAAPRAAMMIGAPAENPLLPGVDVASLAAPLLFEELAEDHSVGLAGNLLIESNFASAQGPAWLVDVADAGHWSPSDLVGLTEGFMPGCGDDTRQEGGAAFTYLPPEEGRALTGALAAAFFAATLPADDAVGEAVSADATAWLGAAGEDARLTIDAR